MGVACFFVLSGFCYALGYGRKVLSSDFRYGDFIKGRLVKFYPLHWITLLLAIPVSLYAALGWKNILVFGANFLLIQSWIPISTVYYSYNGVSWFLSDMVFLVAVFPFVFRWLDSRNKRWIYLLFAGIAYCCICIVTPGPHRNTVLYVNPIVRLCDFTVGILAGMWYQRFVENKAVLAFVQHNKVLLTFIPIVCFAILLLLSVFLSERYTLMAWIFWPAIVIMLLSVSVNPGGMLANPFLHRLGTISFPFYMIHQLVIRYVSMLCNQFDLNLPLTSTIPITLILSIALSMFLNKFVLSHPQKIIRTYKRIGANPEGESGPGGPPSEM